MIFIGEMEVQYGLIRFNMFQYGAIWLNISCLIRTMAHLYMIYLVDMVIVHTYLKIAEWIIIEDMIFNGFAARCHQT